MGLIRRLFGGDEAAAQERGGDVAATLDALAGMEPWWSSEALRRRVRDVFFAVQRSWIERDPELAADAMTAQLLARQRLRIEGLVRQHRVHMLENPLIEDLDFVDAAEAPEPRVTARLRISMVETIRDSRDGALVAGRPLEKLERVEYWVFTRGGGAWLLADVEAEGEGGRHLVAPLVSERYAELSPESVLRERYAREEITLERFEAEMARLLRSEPGY
ncbi:MAG: TIM44-like domain-containing protein [Thermoleophilia bacterium]